MKTFNGISELPLPLAQSVVTIGNFDGLHLGHQALLSEMLAQAKALQVPSVVFTFHPHPVKVLRPEVGLRRLFDAKDLQQQLELRGVDYLVLEPFSREFSEKSPEEFLNNWILKPLHPKSLIVGYDFAFGSNRQGSISTLAQFANEHRIALDVIQPVKSEGSAVSSSRIRAALGSGQVEEAKTLLGRPFYIEGVVEKGVGRGRKLGFATANIRLFSETIPAPGVYVTSVLLEDQCYPSVTNIGNNPTFYKAGPSVPLRVETHILDEDFDIYGRELQIHFICRLRDEMKFSGAEELKVQIEKDVERARQIHKDLRQ